MPIEAIGVATSALEGGLIGILVAALAKFASAQKWNWRLFGYTVGITAVAGVGTIEGFNIDITDGTGTGLGLVSVTGLGFIINKLVQVAARALASKPTK